MLLLGEALLFALLGVVLWRMAFRRGAKSADLASETLMATQLQQSVDVIAVEVERISENQRFVTKLLSEQPSRASYPPP